MNTTECPYEYPMFRVCWIDRLALKQARKNILDDCQYQYDYVCWNLPWWGFITKWKIQSVLGGPSRTLDSYMFDKMLNDETDRIMDYFTCGLPHFELSRVEWIDKLLNQ